jgi:hypothetical protein
MALSSGFAFSVDLRNRSSVRKAFRRGEPTEADIMCETIVESKSVLNKNERWAG